MKPITETLKNNLHKCHAGIRTSKISWDDIFDTEEELVEAMFSEKVQVDGPIMHLCRGYEYIKSFRSYYEKNHCLTEKQMVQLKRLAAEMAFHIYC